MALLHPSSEPIIHTNTIKTKTTTIRPLSLSMCNGPGQLCHHHRHDHRVSSSIRSPSMIVQQMSSSDFSGMAGADSGLIMPEDGLGSPCIIKVLGVGGGGGNAV
eukprot:CAMPEP_0198275086 /NCGR_PEP_ID=MMETSP1447-20131203/63091_1 /TAXON_ID=420782 /ORGANISM="Chaetoceros dichaeta, Strain CCMP1751" /LENGTH=103 /DNA_ID=CAMNT_0043969673 /DNA_START=14 /DNA_END=322 /DNA_ORIENTATION=-